MPLFVPQFFWQASPRRISDRKMVEMLRLKEGLAQGASGREVPEVRGGLAEGAALEE